MTEVKLDPRVRSLLEDQLEERGLEMDVVQQMLQKAQQVEGEALEAACQDILED